MLMWLDIQPYQNQLESNIIKNKKIDVKPMIWVWPSTTEGNK